MRRKKLPVRPTTDMAKEALFNILNNSFYFDDISVIDLFAGTGRISYEFASRGTKQITAVDQDYGCIKFINKTAEAFGMNIQTFKSHFFKFLKKNRYINSKSNDRLVEEVLDMVDSEAKNTQIPPFWRCNFGFA